MVFVESEENERLKIDIQNLESQIKEHNINVANSYYDQNRENMKFLNSFFNKKLELITL